MVNFKDLGLSEEFVAVLEKSEITQPTEIQEKAIPFILEGRDVVGVSATGSGKTLAFASTIIENIEILGKPQALILTPTRELAEQIASAVRSFSEKKFKVFAAYGGTNLDVHIKKISKADIIIATPGRLLDLMNRGAFGFSKIKTLVLDEFDRMLDMGFANDVSLIVKKCPKERQTMLFSATKNDSIDKLVSKYTINSIDVSVKSFVDHSKLEQRYYQMGAKPKFPLLVHLLKYEKSDGVIIFCSTKRNTEFVALNLENVGFDVKIIHGDIDQKKRTRVLKEFHRDGGFLVCTDVAARGLDIKDVSHVYNYDIPRVAADYIHRIGRTARAGKSGRAITLVGDRDMDMFEEILDIKGVKMQEMDTPNVGDLVVKKARREVGSRVGDARSRKISGGSRRRGGEWQSIDDPDLSNRERKRSVRGLSTVDRELSTEKEGKPRADGKKTRRAGQKAKAQGRLATRKAGKRIETHKPSKGTKVKRVRKNASVKKRAKGRSNRKSKK